MLKIKDNVDLKELEKFSYYLGKDDIMQKAYIKDLKDNDYIAIYDDRKIYIRVEDFCGDSWSKFVNDVLYDLIKADIVEKVD